MNCGAGPLQRKMQRLVTPALAVVVVNAVNHACLHGGVMMMMIMMKDESTLAWRYVLRLQGHVTISLNNEVT